MTTYYADPDVTLLHGDALEQLDRLPPASVDCMVTSPPYWNLRDYGVAGQWGAEPTIGGYVDHLVELMRQVRRVLIPTGVAWLNLGDSYAGKANASARRGPGRGHHAVQGPQANKLDAAPYKSLVGVPWRVALALVDDSWTLRNDVIWHKPNAMPHPVTDRLKVAHEHLFLFTPGPISHFNLDAIREPHTALDARAQRVDRVLVRDRHGRQRPDDLSAPPVTWHPLGRNPGDVWSMPTEPSSLAHFALMPQALARRCVLAGCPEGGTVIDPFAGAGTTGVVARQLGRRFIGIELKAEHLDLAVPRFAQQTVVQETA